MIDVSRNLLRHVSDFDVRWLWPREFIPERIGDAILKPNSTSLSLLDGLTLDRTLLNDLPLNELLLNGTLLNLLRCLLNLSRCLSLLRRLLLLRCLLNYILRRSNIKRLLNLWRLLLLSRRLELRGRVPRRRISWRLELLLSCGSRCSGSWKELTLR